MKTQEQGLERLAEALAGLVTGIKSLFESVDPSCDEYGRVNSPLTASVSPRMPNKCSECGGEMIEKPYAHVTRVGPYEHRDASETTLTCACGNYSLSDRQLERYELRAAARILREHPDAAGEVYVFYRKALSMRREEFASMLGVTAEDVIAWEQSKIAPNVEYRNAILAAIDAKLA